MKILHGVYDSLTTRSTNFCIKFCTVSLDFIKFPEGCIQEKFKDGAPSKYFCNENVAIRLGKEGGWLSTKRRFTFFLVTTNFFQLFFSRSVGIWNISAPLEATHFSYVCRSDDSPNAAASLPENWNTLVCSISIVWAAIIHQAKKIIKCLWIMERNIIRSKSEGPLHFKGCI